MHTTPACQACLITLTQKICELSNVPASTRRAAAAFMDQLLARCRDQASPPEMVRSLYAFLAAETGHGDAFDPYCALRKQHTSEALQYLPALRDMVAQAADPLQAALRCAAAGNIIDPGARGNTHISIQEEVRAISGLYFERDESAGFLETLHLSKELLYIGDNAGETVFDRVCIEELQRRIPSCRVTYAVRSRPALNDALLMDARQAGIDTIASLIASGSDCPGTLLHQATPSFRHHFYSSGCVLAKGQGNFETLEGCAHEGLFFMLRVKCAYVAGRTGAAEGTLVLARNRPDNRN